MMMRNVCIGVAVALGFTLTGPAFAETVPAAEPTASEPAVPEEGTPPVEAAAPNEAAALAVLPPAKKKPRWNAALGLAVPFYVYARPMGSPGIHITPNERFQLAETAQIGYYVTPRVAVHLVGIFLETLRSDAGQTGFSFGGVSLYATYRIWRGLNFGAGPMVWFRKYFGSERDVGAYYTFGYTFKLRNTWSLTYAVSSPQGYLHRPVAAFGTGFRLNFGF
ncbi:MAG: hypothetical protein JWP01_3311 [Myxococcales bacterium]|nr:hypothetical protein [Myxococcales bacterium]